jgi:hypothetical protein
VIQRRAAAALVLVLLAASCRAPTPLRRLPADDLRPQALLEEWSMRAGGRRALRATARLAVDAEQSGRSDVRLRSKQLLVLERPALLRVEVLGFLDTTTGPVHEDLLWQVARLDLTPAEAVDLILGVPHPGDALTATAAFDAGDGRIRIQLSDEASAVRRLVDFDEERQLRWLQVRSQDGEVAWEARFDDYALVGGVPVAHEISVVLRDGRSRARISLRDVELNPTLSPDIFRLPGLAPDDASGMESGSEGG